jgi:hypothetical protein
MINYTFIYGILPIFDQSRKKKQRKKIEDRKVLLKLLLMQAIILDYYSSSFLKSKMSISRLKILVH